MPNSAPTMPIVTPEPSRARPWQAVKITLELIKFSHTLFALPFALGALWCAARGWPGWRTFGLVVAAMVTARSTAMAVNRLADQAIDARNPRTAGRPLPAGAISRRAVWGFVAIMTIGFLLSAATLNPLALRLAPVALIVLCGYSFLKRITPWTHVGLGVALGLSPVAAQVAVQATITWPFVLLGLSVAGWVAGFDIIYATMDIEFDRANGLHSVPARYGVPTSLRISRLCHALAAVGFLAFGLAQHFGPLYFVGAALMIVTLIVEQSLVRSDDLSRVNLAFFTANGWVSLLFLAAVLTQYG